MEVESSHKVRVAVAALYAVSLIAQKIPVTTKDVLPILEKKCFQCHGEALKMGNLDLRTRQSMLKGGDKGPAIVPGKGDQSMLIHRVTGKVAPPMPMAPLPALSGREIALLRDWIDQGANWGATTSAQTASEKRISDQDRQWWAFQKPLRR